MSTIKGSRGNYCFVFNDNDKSVKYISQDCIKNVHMDTLKDNNVNIGKYKLFFKLVMSVKPTPYFYYNVCKYSVGDFSVILRLEVSEEDAYIVLLFARNDVPYAVTYRGAEVYGLKTSWNRQIYLKIPYKMVDYVLDLKSSHDFDGIMEAFGNLFGKDLHNFVVEIEVTKLEVETWFEE